MAVEPSIKEMWQKLQKLYNYPVDATGRPIDSKDEETFNVWHDEGLLEFMKK